MPALRAGLELVAERLADAARCRPAVPAPEPRPGPASRARRAAGTRSDARGRPGQAAVAGELLAHGRSAVGAGGLRGRLAGRGARAAAPRRGRAIADQAARRPLGWTAILPRTWPQRVALRQAGRPGPDGEADDEHTGEWTDAACAELGVDTRSWISGRFSTSPVRSRTRSTGRPRRSPPSCSASPSAAVSSSARRPASCSSLLTGGSRAAPANKTRTQSRPCLVRVNDISLNYREIRQGVRYERARHRTNTTSTSTAMSSAAATGTAITAVAQRFRARFGPPGFEPGAGGAGLPWRAADSAARADFGGRGGGDFSGPGLRPPLPRQAGLPRRPRLDSGPRHVLRQARAAGRSAATCARRRSRCWPRSR